MGNAIKDNRGGDCVELPVKNVSPREGQPGLNLSVQIPEVLNRRGNGIAVAKGWIQMMAGRSIFQMKKQAKHSAGSVCRPLLMKNRRRRKTQRSRKL